jgi:glycosyltransferase involved in cell wall biosynthesis
MDLTIVIPCYNEVECLPDLLATLDRFVDGFVAGGRTCEVILVDDGSTDGSADVALGATADRTWLRVLRLRRNFGQTAAMAAGFDHARGDVIVPMDADLQNDPEDIPRLLAEIDRGYDVASGWRRRRQDTFLTRRLPSAVANWFIGRVGGLRLHDYGCTLKAYRREALEHVHLYGEMHRFIPLLARWTGATVTEVEVNHHPRTRGRSKYGLGRTLKVLLDLITVKFLGDYSTKPLYFFGGLGTLLCLAGVASGIFTLVQKFSQGAWVHRNPLLLLAVFLFIVGLLLVAMGLLGELLVRTYHEAQGKPIYLLALERQRSPARTEADPPTVNERPRQAPAPDSGASTADGAQRRVGSTRSPDGTG